MVEDYRFARSRQPINSVWPRQNPTCQGGKKVKECVGPRPAGKSGKFELQIKLGRKIKVITRTEGGTKNRRLTGN